MDTKNVIAAITLSAAVIILYSLFFQPDPEVVKQNLTDKKKMIRGAVKRNKVKRRLRNIINEAIKNISINFNYSYLVIAKITMLNNEYTIIKDTLFQDIKKIK